MIVVFTVAGIQFTLCWNFHRIYMKFHSEFKTVVDNIVEKRQERFRVNLMQLVGFALQDFKKLKGEGKGAMPAKDALKNPEYVKKVKSLSDSVIDAEKPLLIYNETRDAARSAHRYFMISSIVAFLGLIPAITGEAIYNVLYFLFMFSMVFAFIAWEDYYQSEKTLVELRDKGE